MTPQEQHESGCVCADCQAFDGLRQHFEEKCAKAYLTPEQTAQVIDFRLDPWWCNDDRQADVIIDFFHRQNDQQDEKRLADCYTYRDQVCLDPLCPVHGDVRDTSAVR